MCAVLLRSGRVCGGRRGAITCVIKGAAKPDAVPPAVATLKRHADSCFLIVPSTTVLPAKARPKTKATPKPASTPSSERDLLDLEHDISKAAQTKTIKVWARGRIVNKILDMIRKARQAVSLPPKTASKLYGTANLFEQGAFGKISRAGPKAIEDRQYEACSHLAPQITSSLSLLDGHLCLASLVLSAML